LTSPRKALFLNIFFSFFPPSPAAAAAALEAAKERGRGGGGEVWSREAGVVAAAARVLRFLNAFCAQSCWLRRRACSGLL